MALLFWGLTHPSVLDCLFKVQKRVIRAISFKDKFTHTTLFYEHKILKLRDIHSLKLLYFVYECPNNSITPVFDSYLNQLQTVHSYNTRQASKGNIYLTGVNTIQYGKRSAKFAGGILWNGLSVELRKFSSVQIFKKNLQVFYLSAYLVQTHSSQLFFVLLLL